MNLPELLRYGTEQHDKIRNAVLARYRMSQRAMSDRYSDWKRAEEDFRAYTPESEEDKRRKSERSKGILHYTTITVPMTYAMAMTAHTYWTSVFLNRNPIFQLMSRKGSGEQSTLAMEALLDYQVNVGGMLPVLFVWLLDPAKYGIGIIRSYWTEEVHYVGEMYQVPVIDPVSGLPIPGRFETVKETQKVPGYRGNKIYNVRPHSWFPDPRVPVADFQSGEFCGDVTYRSLASLRAEGGYFNLDSIGRRRGSIFRSEPQDGQLQLPVVEDILQNTELDDGGSVRILEMFIRIIPKEWGLGDGSWPEKWLFVLANDEVIIGAEPCGYYHGRFPYDLLMYEVEGYALNIRGMLEIGRDFNLAQSWLVNSHMFNVRRALNNQLLVDPSRVVMADLLEGGPGKLIRARPQAYGTPLRDAVVQLPIMDVTRSHISDTQLIGELAYSVLGVNQNVMGALDAGGRKTATEVRAANTFAISRLKTITEWFSATGFSPLCQKLVQNTQQFQFANGEIGIETYRIVGDFAADFQGVEVTPESIAGFYDYAPVDGTLPIDRMAQANIFKEILQVMLNSPQLASAYNIDAMINWIARMVGVRNLKQFQIRVMPDEVVRQQAEAGNLVPIGGQNGLRGPQAGV